MELYQENKQSKKMT